jgi:hypothetical protein
MHNFNDHLNFFPNLYDNVLIRKKLLENKFLTEVEANHPDITPQLIPQAMEPEFTPLPGTPKGPPTSPANNDEYWRRLEDLEKEWFRQVDEWAQQFYRQNGRWPSPYEYRQYGFPLWQQMWQGSGLGGIPPDQLSDPAWQQTHPKGDPGHRWFSPGPAFFTNEGDPQPFRGFERWWEWKPGM